MKLEEQVCSRELAKRLKELGVKQDSLVYWISNSNLNIKIYSIGMSGSFNKIYNKKNAVSAFTVAELLEMLPDIDNRTDPRRLSFGMEYKDLRESVGGKYFCVDLTDYPHHREFYSDNFADCLASMVIHLIEKGIINHE